MIGIDQEVLEELAAERIYLHSILESMIARGCDAEDIRELRDEIISIETTLREARRDGATQ